MSAYLDIRSALSTVERALVDAISLAYQWRRPAVDSLDALAALPSAPNKDGQLCFVTPEGVVYRFKRYSTNAEARPYVVKPSDLADDKPGRWERCNSNVTKGPAYFRPVHRVETGYAKQVLLWQGEGGSGEALDRIFGSTPAFLVRFVSLDLGSRKTAGPYGAMYSYDVTFEVWCFSKNYRPQNQALYGSDVASEQDADDDPGLNRMIGDIQYLFGSGCELGLSPGVAQVRINGTTNIVHEELDDREFVASVPLLIQASLNIPDEDLVPLDEIWVQFQNAQVTGDAPDLDNYVVKGYRLDYGTGTGLSVTPSAGVAYVGGQLVSSQPGAHLFTANKWTYRYLLTDGSLYYAETDPGKDAPSGPSGSLLIGVTQTDSSDVVFDAIVCDFANDSGEPFRAK